MRTDIAHNRMAQTAWRARESARVIGPTRVGAAVLAADGEVFGGCNMEHRYRSHDVHAEISAISSLVASGRSTFSAILVAAERELFTPCGACLDWIFEIGGPEADVIVQSSPGGAVARYRARELMPFYPR